MRQTETHVLIVDDEPEIRELFKETLEASGHACHMSANGDSALSVLATQPVDLALVDITMPGMSGFTLFEHIKERWPNTAVIFVTAMDNVAVGVDNLKQGAYDYLVKPVSQDRLDKAVEEVLTRRDASLHDRWQIDQRARELSALNRLFQRHLDDEAAIYESQMSMMDRLQILAEHANDLARHADALYELVQSGPVPDRPGAPESESDDQR